MLVCTPSPALVHVHKSIRHIEMWFHSPAGPPANLYRLECTPSTPTNAGFDGPLPFPNWVPCGLGPAGSAGRSDTTPRERQSSRATGSTINLCIISYIFDWKKRNYTLFSTGDVGAENVQLWAQPSQFFCQNISMISIIFFRTCG